MGALLLLLAACDSSERDATLDAGTKHPSFGETTPSGGQPSADDDTPAMAVGPSDDDQQPSLPAGDDDDTFLPPNPQVTDAGSEPGALDAGIEPGPTDAGGVFVGVPDAATEAPLRAVPGASRYALVGEQVTLDGSASTGAFGYEWFTGNGEPASTSDNPVTQVIYDAPGRYQAVLTVYNEDGNRHTAGVTISVTYPSVGFGTRSRTLAAVPGSDDVVAVSGDSNQLIVLSPSVDGEWSVSRRIDTCSDPRTVTVIGAFFATACQRDDSIGFYPVAGGPGIELPLPYGAAPFGVATDGSRLFVSLQGSGSLLVAGFAAGIPVVESVLPAISDARAVASLPDGRIAVTRWRSPNDRGEIALVDPAGTPPEILYLAFDPQAASDAELGGVPSYLAEFAPSPTGREAFVPSLMANHTQGAYLSGRALTFETTVRAALSRVDLGASREDFGARYQFDERGFAGAIAFSSRGDFGYVVMPGNRSIVVFDLLTGVETGVLLDAGFAPDGAVVVNEDKTLLVNAALSRELVVYDASGASPLPVARVPLLEIEPLDPVVLRGKQLFNDAADRRLADNGYIACAHCHLEGDSDQRVWDFTDRGEGLRNTISMLGRAGTGDGPVHWSANFDEIQDFEHDIRSAFGGTGLMADADFHSGTRNTSLGDPKAGVSEDLDALAAYVESLRAEPKSPYREADGSLGEAALRGKTLFESAQLGCTSCHSGPRLTDSQLLAPATPLLHDVGTLGPGTGQRLGTPLSGLDTPTLHGLWASAPYLHDGSATTLQQVVGERNSLGLHGTTSQLSAAERDDLVAYLLCLDGSID